MRRSGALGGIYVGKLFPDLRWELQENVLDRSLGRVGRTFHERFLG